MCERETCHVCNKLGSEKPKKCKQSNVVYEAVCVTCEQQNEEGERPEINVYIGESSRSLAERFSEHVSGLMKGDEGNFIVKHWALKHIDQMEPPEMRFRVLRSFREPLTRVLTAAVLIEKISTMNSKSEWGHTKLKRLCVEKTYKEEVKLKKEDVER